MNLPKLPRGYHWEHDEIVFTTSEGAEIARANFYPYVTQAQSNGPQNGNPLITFNLYVNGKRTSPSHRLYLTELKTIDLEAFDINCQSQGDPRKIAQLMYSVARYQAAALGVSDIPLLTHTGWTPLNGTSVYVAGNRVLGEDGWISPSKYSLSPSLTALSLNVDEQLSEAKAAQYVRKICRLHPGVTDILMASAVVGHLFSLFVEAGVTPRLVLYLVGPSMMKKTTLAQLIGETYSRTSEDCPHLVNLLSTSSAVHAHVSALSDCCTIIDDLNASESNADMRRREERLSEIIRTAGNGAGKEKMDGGNSVSQVPRGIIFVTAEYTLKAYSTMARCVVVHLNTPVGNESLTSLQQRPKALSTFWFYFLKWCCEHYDEIIESIRKEFSRHRQNGAQIAGMERLGDAYFTLNLSMEILATYMKTSVPESTVHAGKMQQRFEQSLDMVQNRQIRELQALRQNADPDRFSKMVADLYYGAQLDLRKKKHLGPGCNGAEGKRLLYLDLSYLTREAQRYFREESITDRAITTELRKNGLLEMDKSGRSTKKVNRVRYLHIPLDRLLEYRSNFLALRGSHELVDIFTGEGNHLFYNDILL